MSNNVKDPYASKPWLKFYDKNVPAEVDIPEIPVFDFLDKAAKDFPKRTAMFFQKRRINYKEFKETAERIATALLDLGLKKGDVVALMIPNFPQYLFSFYGILKAGGRVTAVSPLYTEHELEYQLNDCGAEFVIAYDSYLDKIRNVKDRTRIRHVIITSIFDYTPDYHKNPPEIAGTTQFLTLVKNTKPDKKRLEEIAKNIKPKKDVALYQYTGGTTGLPKGAMLTHFNLVANVMQIAAWNIDHTRRGKDAVLTNLPLVHIYGITICMNFPIHMGLTIGLNPDPRDEKSLFELIRDIQPAMFPGVPTMYMRLLERDDIEDYARDLKSIRVCNTGAMAMPPEILKEFEKRTGALIIEGYGMTETSCASHVNPVNKETRKIGSIGLPLPSTESKLVDIDDDSKLVPQGERGEVMIRGPQIMQGYWNKPEATRNQLSEDGWLKTGDIAVMDEDGYFFIVDRKKDMINVSGYKVYPREVEDLLYEHEAVEKCSVIGVPDQKIDGSERVKAFIVLKEKYRESEELNAEIRDYCRKSLAPYKVPKFVEFRKELPETFVGKVLKKDLKLQEARERGELEE